MKDTHILPFHIILICEICWTILSTQPLINVDHTYRNYHLGTNQSILESVLSILKDNMTEKKRSSKLILNKLPGMPSDLPKLFWVRSKCIRNSLEYFSKSFKKHHFTFLAYQKLYWICDAKNGQKRILPKFRKNEFFSIFEIW